MHISDALISAPVAMPLWVASLGTAAYAIKKINLEEDTEKLPLIGVMGAFTFAAQMINFAIPGTGASGHLAGGLLLAILLGPHLGYLTMMSLLLIQALFFGDGGLIAYGANVFNMGLIACYGIYPLVYLPLKKRMGKYAVVLSGMVGVLLSALSVVIQIGLSGTVQLSFTWFLISMLGVHALIGLVEGGITQALVSYLKTYLPDRMETMTLEAEDTLKPNVIYKLMGGASLVVAGFLSYYASAHPDGLEWSLENNLLGHSGIESATAIQNVLSKFSDYQVPFLNNDRLSVGLAGLIGILLTYLMLTLIGRYVLNSKQKKTKSEGECTDV